MIIEKVLKVAGIVFGIVLSFFVSGSAFAQVDNPLVAPTLVKPNPSEIVTKPNPIITGLTLNNTLVDIYIDEVFDGKATTKNGPSGIASWSYETFLPLETGEHVVYTVARDTSETIRSIESSRVMFRVEKPFPAPTILGLNINPDTTYKKPQISGLAKNDSLVDIYIDGNLDGTIQVTNHPSGTTHFTYTPTKDLQAGWHAINVLAKDPRGKQSILSQALVFEVRDTVSQTIELAPQITSDNFTIPNQISAPTLIKPASQSITSESKPNISGLAHNDQAIEVFIDGILNGEIKAQKHPSGTYSFTYKPFLRLEPGVHIVTSKAVAPTGLKSGWSNSLVFLAKSREQKIVVSPSGIQSTRLVNSSGVVAATSTEETTSDKPEAPEETKPEITKPEISEAADENLPEVIIEDAFDPDVKPEIIIIDERNATSTSTTSASNESGNTALVVLLAIAAIVIIGFISWYTSRETDEETPKTKSADYHVPEPEPMWEEETIDLENTEDEIKNYKDDDIPPPPPPPALGI